MSVAPGSSARPPGKRVMANSLFVESSGWRAAVCYANRSTPEASTCSVSPRRFLAQRWDD
jgi:hypothetical protein